MDTAQWSLRALTDSFAGDPARAFAFVRDSIGYDVYPGVLRGAAGTLAARAGNAWDRAILLKTLLDAMSLTTRFATAELDTTTAERVAAHALDPVVTPLEDGRSVAAGQVRLDDVGRRAARDYASLRGALGDRVDAMRALLPDGSSWTRRGSTSGSSCVGAPDGSTTTRRCPTRPRAPASHPPP